MKKLVNRFYYSLAELVGNDSPATALPSFDAMIYSISEIWVPGTATAAEQTMFQDYLWPEFYSTPVCYYDVETNPWEDPEDPDLDDVIEANQDLLGRFHRWYQESKKRYIFLIQKYEALESQLLGKVKSTTTSRVRSSDTPQALVEEFDLDYVSRADQSTVTLESDVNTPIERFREVQEKLHNLYADWANEFQRFVIQSAE